MAKVNGNLFMDRMSGSVGDQMIIRRIRGGRTIICAKPTFGPDRTFSEAQLSRQQAFREASAYAKEHKRDPIYLSIAEGTARTGYNVALGDCLTPPRILEIDMNGWHGGAMEPIRVRAQDDVKVVQVRVEIADETGTILEAGQAADAGALWWAYPVTQPLRGALTVTVTACDLPGNTAQASETKILPPE
jgi:hypothetical protein